MKNKVILIIILLSIFCLAITTMQGVKIGDFSILSIEQLKIKNNELNEKINKASVLTSIDYSDNIEKLEETHGKYKVTKQEYNELLGFVDEKKEDRYETKQYDIGYLWKIFGKYATSRNIGIGMDVQQSNKGKDSYNLNFIISGQYVNISQFIADIENNSDLYFRIYNFKMYGSGENITATFTVKDISIDPSTLSNVGTTIDNMN